MIHALPVDACCDPARLAALSASDLLDTPPEPPFDRLTRLAARLLRAPVAFVSLVDADRQFFKSCVGLPEPWASARETPLSHSFCRHVVASGAPLAVDDARAHPLVRDNLAIRDMGVVAYLGVPLVTARGQTLGALAVVDASPRGWSNADRDTLTDLAAAVMTEVELRGEVRDRRGAEHALTESETRLRQLAECITDVFWLGDAAGDTLYVSPAYGHVLGCPTPPIADVGARWFAAIHPEDIARVVASWASRARAVETEYRIVRPDGAVRWVQTRVYPVPDATGALYRMAAVTRDVTAARDVQGRLRESEERYRLSAAATRDVIYDWDIATNVVHRIGSGESMLGYAAEDLKPNIDVWRAQLHPEDGERVAAALRTALESPSATGWSCEYRMRGLDGGYLTVADRGTIVRDAAGTARRVVGAVTDLTGQRGAESALRASEGRFRGLVEAAHEGIWALDAVGHTTYVNPRMAEMLGHPVDELLGRELFDFMDPPTAFEARTLFARWQRGIPVSHEFTFRRADGAALRATVSVSPLQDPDAAFVGAFALVSDVTQRWQAEAALRESEARLRFALGVAGMIVWERELATDQVHHGALPSGGAESHVAADQMRDYARFLDAVHPEDRAGVARANADAVARCGEFRVEYRIVGANGAVRWNHSVGRVIADADGWPARMVGVSLDITDRQALEGQLRQAQKMEAVGRLAGGVAHDFNNLLTVISANTAFARESLPTDDPALTDLAEVEAAARRAADLTTQLLAFSRQQVLMPQHVDLNQVVADVERMLLRVIGADVAVATDLSAEAAAVYADAGQLGQVLMNLAVNARDAMPTGGTLTIQTLLVAVDAAVAAARPGLVPGAYVALRVRDTGVGMDAATQAQIFEPFFTTKEVGQGTGLGLSTVDGIVKQSGGYVYVESAPGTGSTFTVLLPHGALGADAAAAPAPTLPPRGAETVLLIEDEAQVRAAVRRMLERGGYRVLEAEHGGAALALAADHAGRIDLVLTDMVMPETEAGAMLVQLRDRRPGLPALLMSGYSAEAVAARGTIVEDAPLLAKPFTAGELLRHVREVLDQR